MDIWLIRHTSVDCAAGVCYGRMDVPVSLGFHQEADRILSILKAEVQGEYAVYSSPAQRCRKLAELLSNGKTVFDERLQELDFGEWEGKKWEDLEQGYLQQWMNSYVSLKCPGGESYFELYQRVALFLDDLKKQMEKRVVIITHGGSLRAMLAALTGIPLESAFNFSFDTGRISKISWSSDYPKVEYLNK